MDYKKFLTIPRLLLLLGSITLKIIDAFIKY